MIYVTAYFSPHHFFEGGELSYIWNLSVWGGYPCPFVVQCFSSFLPWQHLKEAIKKLIANSTNKGSINVLSNIYHPPPPPPMRKKIKIIIYMATFTVVPELDSTILPVIAVYPMLIELLLKQQ